MNIEEYISSGILERYILDSTSKQESQEVECMSKIYPEIREELDHLTKTIENLSIQNAVQPPAHLKSKLFEKIKVEKQEARNNETTALTSSKQHQNKSLGRFAIAASIAVLIISGIVYAYMRNNQLNIENQLSQLKVENKKLINDKIKLDDSNKTQEELLALLKNPDTEKINLSDIKNPGKNLASVFWNKASEETFIQHNLPELNQENQYQLWTIIDEKPVDMGMISKDPNTDLITQMKSTKNADAFAITIEPLGGSKVPSLEQLVVLGKV